MRLFVAVELPAVVRGALAAAVDRLRPLALDVAWVASQNVHVTLKFLGEVDAGRLVAVRDALGQAAAVDPFDVRVRGLDAFPAPASPRVLWAGIADGAEGLGMLAHRVDDALAGAGFPREDRPFAAHVTLGRVRQPRRTPALAAAIDGARALDFGPVHVDQVVLVRSELSPRGARHTALDVWPLARG